MGNQQVKTNKSQNEIDEFKGEPLFKEYEFIKIIKEGHRWIYVKAYNNKDGKIYSIKIYRLKEDNNNPSPISLAENEYNILNYIDQKIGCTKYVLCGNKFQKTEKFFYIITEYLYGYIDLEEFIDQKISTEQYNTIANNLCYGLHSLHQIDVVHRNINLSNILIDPTTLNIKFVDFMNAFKHGNRYNTTYYSDERYQYPNMPTEPGYFHLLINVDLWQLGNVLYVLALKKYPIEEFKRGNGDPFKGNRKISLDAMPKFYGELIKKANTRFFDSLNQYRSNKQENPINLSLLFDFDIKSDPRPKYYCEQHLEHEDNDYLNSEKDSMNSGNESLNEHGDSLSVLSSESG